MNLNYNARNGKSHIKQLLKSAKSKISTYELLSQLLIREKGKKIIKNTNLEGDDENSWLDEDAL